MTGDRDEQQPEPRPSRGMSRRALVFGGVGVAGLAIGAGATEAADRASRPEPAPPVEPATEELMTDHGMLMRILLVYRECARRLTAGDQLDPAPLFHSAQMVHDYIEGFHEGIEEGYIFPRLLRAGKLQDLVRTLLVQHDRGRKVTVAIIQASSTMSMPGMGSAPGFATDQSRHQLAGLLGQFIDMYEPHEAREDTVVFPAFRDVTSDGTFERVSEQVHDAQDKRYGANGFAAFLQQIDDIERQLGIHDLSKFTPPVPPARG